MATHALRQVLSFKTLLAVSFFILLNACGDGTGFSTDEILGGAGGETFYTDPLTDEDEAGVPADDDSTYSPDESVGSSGGIADYSAPSDETAGIDIPVNIAKYDDAEEIYITADTVKWCEVSFGEDEDDEDDTVYSVMTREAANRSKISSAKKPRVILRGAPGTFPNFDGELSLAVINLSTGKSVTAEIFDDGSFPAVTMEMESASDAILVGAFDGETFTKAYAFLPRAFDDGDESDICAVPDEEESFELAREFTVPHFRR